MFNSKSNYSLDIQNGDMRNKDQVCIWNGLDFIPIKDVLITDPPIPANEPINNRVTINSVKEMS